MFLEDKSGTADIPVGDAKPGVGTSAVVAPNPHATTACADEKGLHESDFSDRSRD
jgi:hypothetical protein